jgi:integrase
MVEIDLHKMKTNTSEAKNSVENKKSGTQTGHNSSMSHFPADLVKADDKVNRPAKSSIDYWKEAVTPRMIRGTPTPELYVRFRESGRDVWVCLNTPNRSSAATKARDLWLNVKAKGIDVAIAEFNPKSAPRPARSATVGELIAEARALTSVRPATLLLYESSLRRLVAGVRGMTAAGSVFYHKSKEGAERRAKIDATSLDVLGAAEVEQWRRAYISAAPDEIARVSAKNTTSSIIRNARGFFSAEMLKLLAPKIRLPVPTPLVGVSAGSSMRRFKTNVNPRTLYAAALAELKGDTLTAFLLCLTAGLRKSEADFLEWDNVDLASGFINITTTRYFVPKTSESERTTPIPPDVVAHLTRLRAKNTKAELILNGLNPAAPRHPKAYRCPCWSPLAVWLRTKGFVSQNPIHELRKLSGSLVNAVAGLEAARRHLGHRNITTTAASYVTGSAALVNLAAIPAANSTGTEGAK